MAKTRTVQMYTKEAVDKAKGISHDDYKAIKHMNKIELTHYLHRIYTRGFEDGKKIATNGAETQEESSNENI